MKPTEPQMSVCFVDPAVVVKLKGRANVALSVPFKALMLEALQRGRSCFALELSECLLMDSTFLGVLANFGVRFEKENPEKPQRITLISPSPKVLDLLDNLGTSHFFKVIQNSAPPADQFKPVASPDAPVSKEEISRTCLEAHKLLMAIDPRNVPKFKDVTQFLAEDLKKLEGGK